MVIAILTAKRGDITGLTALVGFEEWSYLVFFIWLALAGAGPLSIDALIGRLRHRRGDVERLLTPVGDLDGRSPSAVTRGSQSAAPRAGHAAATVS